MWKRVRRVLAIPGFLAGLFLLFRGEFVPELHAWEAAGRDGYHDVLFLRRNDHLLVLHGCDPLDATALEITADDASHKRKELTICVGWPFFADIIHER